MNRTEIQERILIDLPDNFELYPADVQEKIVKYLSSFTPIEKKAYAIAKSHLGSSFNIIKSNGYNDWNKSN